MRRPFVARLLAAILLLTGAGLPLATAAAEADASPPAPLPRLSRMPIGDTGAAAYLFGTPSWQSATSRDGTPLVHGVAQAGNLAAGVMVIRFPAPRSDLDEQGLEALLLQNLQVFCKDVLELTQTLPPGRGQRLRTHPSALGALVIGHDEADIEHWVKGWIDPNGIGIVYVFGQPMPNHNWTTLVLDGFRFPGD